MLGAKHCAKAVKAQSALLFRAGLAHNLVQREKINKTISKCDKGSEGFKTG